MDRFHKALAQAVETSKYPCAGQRLFMQYAWPRPSGPGRRKEEQGTQKQKIKGETGNDPQEKNPREKNMILCFFCLFCAVFLFSGYVLINN